MPQMRRRCRAVRHYTQQCKNAGSNAVIFFSIAYSFRFVKFLSLFGRFFPTLFCSLNLPLLFSYVLLSDFRSKCKVRALTAFVWRVYGCGKTLFAGRAPGAVKLPAAASERTQKAAAALLTADCFLIIFRIESKAGAPRCERPPFSY